MRDYRAFAEALADQVAKVFSFVIESAGGIRLVEFYHAAIEAMNGGARRVPPVGVDDDVALGGRKHRVAVTEQVEAGVELGHSALVLGVNDCEGIDPGRVETAEGMDALEGTKPVEREKGFIGANAHDAAASKFREMEWVVRSQA